MEREQYAVMARREDDHWWYAGMRRVALRVLQQALDDRGQALDDRGHALDDRGHALDDRAQVLDDRALELPRQAPPHLGRDARRPQPQGHARAGLLVLDAGCGTGGTTARLRRFGRVVGVDLAWEALEPARQRGLHGRLTRGDIQRLPFRDATFDAATSFEVVYHLGVANDQAALAELRRVLKRDGLLLLRVPAHDWLRGAHDRLVHTRHRYAPDEVRTKLAQAGFAVERLAWANSLLFPAAAAKRLLLERASPPSEQGATGRSRLPEHAGLLDTAAQGGPGAPGGPGGPIETAGVAVDAESESASAAEPDLWLPPEPLNALLEGLVAVEAPLLARGFSFPFGLSLLAVARAM